MFKIGEFSQLAQVSPRLLRFYEEIGLFTPAATDPATGYRFYHAAQLQDLNRILALRELGLALEEITRLVRAKVPVAEMRALLEKRKAEIERTLAHEQARLRQIETRLHQLEAPAWATAVPVVVKRLPALVFLARRVLCPTYRDLLRLFYEVDDARRRNRWAGGVWQTCLNHNATHKTAQIDVEMGLALESDRDAAPLPLPSFGDLKPRPLEAVIFAATAVFRADGSQHRTYQALGQWMEDNGYTFGGPEREVFLHVAAADAGGQDATIVEVQIPLATAP